jgi:hypothetical protein
VHVAFTLERRRKRKVNEKGARAAGILDPDGRINTGWEVSLVDKGRLTWY